MSAEDRLAAALSAIAEERRRQVEAEGWTPAHDAEHEPGHLLRAGIFYLWHGTDKAAPIEPNGAPLAWPWEPEWWKPKDRRRNLVRAGALMLAERDAVLSRHRARLHQERERYARKGLEVRRFTPGPPHTGHVEHKLQIVLRELCALDAEDRSRPAELSAADNWAGEAFPLCANCGQDTLLRGPRGDVDCIACNPPVGR